MNVANTILNALTLGLLVIVAVIAQEMSWVLARLEEKIDVLLERGRS